MQNDPCARLSTQQRCSPAAFAAAEWQNNVDIRSQVTNIHRSSSASWELPSCDNTSELLVFVQIDATKTSCWIVIILVLKMLNAEYLPATWNKTENTFLCGSWFYSCLLFPLCSTESDTVQRPEWTSEWTGRIRAAVLLTLHVCTQLRTIHCRYSSCGRKNKRRDSNRAS